jgi:hypothetical protein
MEIKTETTSGFKLWSDTIELIPTSLCVLAYGGDKKAKEQILAIKQRNNERKRLREIRESSTK